MNHFQFSILATTATTATTFYKKYSYKLKTYIKVIKKVVAGSSTGVAGSSRFVCCYPVVAEKARKQPKKAKVVAVVAEAAETHRQNF